MADDLPDPRTERQPRTGSRSLGYGSAQRSASPLRQGVQRIPDWQELTIRHSPERVADLFQVVFGPEKDPATLTEGDQTLWRFFVEDVLDLVRAYEVRDPSGFDAAAARIGHGETTLAGARPGERERVPFDERVEHLRVPHVNVYRLDNGEERWVVRFNGAVPQPGLRGKAADAELRRHLGGRFVELQEWIRFWIDRSEPPLQTIARLQERGEVDSETVGLFRTACTSLESDGTRPTPRMIAARMVALTYERAQGQRVSDETVRRWPRRYPTEEGSGSE